MRWTKFSFWALGLLTTLALASQVTSQNPAPVVKNQPMLNAIEVQTRGPIHEAFAQPFDNKPAPGEIVPKEPPPAIPEDPPTEQPDIGNADWIPGYWAWDAERRDYMWVSGVYRVAPQGRTFVPGYWSQTDGGWRWIPGFWTGQNQQDLPYTPEPPAPLDSQPQLEPPNDDSVYIPGTWIWRGDRFIWRPGYFAAAQAGRVWVPPTYIWTPNGYLFVDGYWDYPFDSRGLLYAPVYFNSPLWNTPGWRYRPGFALSFGAFFDSAFSGPGFQFYFGNYYGPGYAGLGYRPWYSGRGRYDPVFAQYGWQNHRGNRNWVAGVQQTYANRAAGRAAVPPRTFAQQNALVASKKGSATVVPVGQFKGNNVRIVKASPTRVAQQKVASQKTRQLAVNRQRLDATGAKQGFNRNLPQGRTLNLPTMQTRTPGVTNIPGGTRVNPSRPAVVTPKGGKQQFVPKNVTPKGSKQQFVPRSVTPKVGGQQFVPRNVTPKAVPRVTPQVAPRHVAPRPVPRVAPQVAPRVNVPRYTAPRPAPVVRSAPQYRPAPVVRSAPQYRPGAPRISAPQRSSRPPAARPGGGGGRPGGGRRR
ncbi:MAG: YXWGXW repeat-containing protein [Planctomycetes bacterium]|nr:YXWGXW repeat-containing protein [Planctomycetota bacterium]